MSARAEAALLLRLQPLRRPAPQRVEMLGAEKTEMADDCSEISPMIACPAFELSQGNFV